MKKLILYGYILFSFLQLNANENINNFSKLPDVGSIKISPNGEMIGVLRKIDGERMLSIINLETKELIFNHRYVKKGEIGGFEWLSDERLLMSKITKFSGSNSPFPTGELYAVNIDGKKEIILTGRQAKKSSDTSKDDPKKPARLIDLLPDEPNKIMVQFISSDKFWRLYKVNTDNGEIERYAVPPVREPYYQFDVNGQLIAVLGVNKDYDVQIYLYNKNIPTEFFVGSSCQASEVDCIEVVEKKSGTKSKNPDWTFWKEDTWDSRLKLISYTKDTNNLITIENLGYDKSGVYETNLSTGKRKLLYRHKVVDVDNVLIDSETGEPYAATFMDGYHSAVFFKGESKEKERTKFIKSIFPNSTFSSGSFSKDEKLGIIFVSSDVNPGIYYLVNYETEQFTPLGKYWGSIDYSNLATMEPISFKTKDNATVHGYLTRSKIGRSSESPTILHVHGGPEGVRDRWGFDVRTQMLASEGFNVLQINFRGSGGYGLDHQRFISANWDGVLNDLFDGMDYLHAKGEINKFNSCIYGGSYGGYAATQGAILRPDLFKCSVSDVGVYDVGNLFNTGDIRGYRGGKAQLVKRLGNDEKRHREMSPYYNAEKLKVPFFMIHGENDVRAPFEDAVKFSEKLNKIGFDHKTLFVAKEGHGYYDEEIRYNNNIQLIEFFREHLD